MDGRLVCALLFAALLSAAGVCAQTPTTEAPRDPPPASGSVSIDPTKLGVSFDRVRVELAQAARSRAAGLKIQETVEVVGKAPKLELWDPKTVNLTSQKVPFGAPTQKDIMKLIVPKEFQTYPLDLNALMQWLMEHLNKTEDK